MLCGEGSICTTPSMIPHASGSGPDDSLSQEEKINATNTYPPYATLLEVL